MPSLGLWRRSAALNQVCKATLASILRKSRPGVRLNEYLGHNCGQTVFQHACKMAPGGDRLETPGLALQVGTLA